MKLPPVVHLRQDDTRHLVQYALDEQRSLSRLADDAADLSSITELERLTGLRVLGESGLLPGVSIHELAFGITYAHIVNAAFTYAHPTGSRFNGQKAVHGNAAFRLETSQAEVAYHRAKEFRTSTGLILGFSNTWSIWPIFGPSLTTSGSNQTFVIVCHPIAMLPHGGWLKCFFRKVKQESSIQG